MHEIEFHPAVHLFPPLSSDEYQALKKDIQENGLAAEITVWKGQLIDGRHRVQICNELGIDYRGFLGEVPDDEDPIKLALSLNLHRRQLSQSQKAMVADKVRDIYDGEAKERQQEGGKTAGNGRPKKVVENLPQPKDAGEKSRDKAAATVGVSGKLADAAKTVRTKGSEELQAAVEAGDVAVSAAAEVARAKPKAEQTKAVKNGTVKQEASKARAAKKKPKSNSAAAKALRREIVSGVNGFLKLNPTPKELFPVMDGLDLVMNKVEKAMTG